MLSKQTKASRQAREMVELSGGVVEVSKLCRAIPAPYLIERFFRPYKELQPCLNLLLKPIAPDRQRCRR
jgi:hypothetical protein